MKPETQITVTLGLINGLLGYLGTRPYGEVFQLIQEMQAQVLPQVPMPAEKPAPVDD